MTNNFSTGNFSTGDLCTDDGEYLIFNKPTKIDRGDLVFPDFFNHTTTAWVTIDDMTDDEKTKNHNYRSEGGYLKVLDYKEAWTAAWKGATYGDKRKLFTLPNFDADIFEEITGIDVRK